MTGWQKRETFQGRDYRADNRPFVRLLVVGCDIAMIRVVLSQEKSMNDLFKQFSQAREHTAEDTLTVATALPVKRGCFKEMLLSVAASVIRACWKDLDGKRCRFYLKERWYYTIMKFT